MSIKENIKIIEEFSTKITSMEIEEVIQKQKDIFDIIEKTKHQFDKVQKQKYEKEFIEELSDKSISELLNELNIIDNKFQDLSIEDMHLYKEKALFIISSIEKRIIEMQFKMHEI